MKNILLFLITLSTLYANSQDCYTIRIQKSENPYEFSPFYFKTVIDGRSDSSNIIGDVRIGELNVLQCASFSKKINTTVLNFLQKTYPNKTAPPFLVKINSLYIEELIFDDRTDIGKATAELEFYKYTASNELVFITKVFKTVQDKYTDVTASHDNRLKRVLLLCVNDFEQILKKDSISFTIKTSQAELEKREVKKSDSITIVPFRNNELSKLTLQIQCKMGLTTKGIGMRIGSYFFLKKYPKVAIGPSLFWDYFGLNKRVIIPSDVDKVKYTIFDVGLNSFVRLNDRFGVAIDGYLLFGRESITRTSTSTSYSSTLIGWQTNQTNYTNTNTDFISGFHAEQGIQFIRKEKNGVNWKLSIYETILSGTFYDSDFGVKLSLGINF